MIIVLQVLLMAIPLILYIFEYNKNKKLGYRLNGPEVVRRIFSYGSLLIMTYSMFGSIFLLVYFILNISLKHLLWLMLGLMILYISKKYTMKINFENNKFPLTKNTHLITCVCFFVRMKCPENDHFLNTMYEFIL